MEPDMCFAAEERRGKRVVRKVETPEGGGR